MAKEISNTTRTFLIEKIETVVHIINISEPDKDLKMVVYDDAYRQDLGKVEFLTKSQIKQKFDISL